MPFINAGAILFLLPAFSESNTRTLIDIYRSTEYTACIYYSNIDACVCVCVDSVEFISISEYIAIVPLADCLPGAVHWNEPVECVCVCVCTLCWASEKTRTIRSLTPSPIPYNASRFAAVSLLSPISPFRHWLSSSSPACVLCTVQRNTAKVLNRINRKIRHIELPTPKRVRKKTPHTRAKR